MEEMTILEKLNRVMGYFQNDSYRKVILDQDDACGNYILMVGDKSYYGDSLGEVINKAYEGEGDPW